jgi:hypothetical protein
MSKLRGTVIPGRASFLCANPESRPAVRDGKAVWIPGSPLRGAPE